MAFGTARYVVGSVAAGSVCRDKENKVPAASSKHEANENRQTQSHGDENRTLSVVQKNLRADWLSMNAEATSGCTRQKAKVIFRPVPSKSEEGYKPQHRVRWELPEHGRIPERRARKSIRKSIGHIKDTTKAKPPSFQQVIMESPYIARILELISNSIKKFNTNEVIGANELRAIIYAINGVVQDIPEDTITKRRFLNERQPPLKNTEVQIKQALNDYFSRLLAIVKEWVEISVNNVPTETGTPDSYVSEVTPNTAVCQEQLTEFHINAANVVVGKIAVEASKRFFEGAATQFWNGMQTVTKMMNELDISTIEVRANPTTKKKSSSNQKQSEIYDINISPSNASTSPKKSPVVFFTPSRKVPPNSPDIRDSCPSLSSTTAEPGIAPANLFPQQLAKPTSRNRPNLKDSGRSPSSPGFEPTIRFLRQLAKPTSRKKSRKKTPNSSDIRASGPSPSSTTADPGIAAANLFLQQSLGSTSRNADPGVEKYGGHATEKKSQPSYADIAASRTK